MNEIQKPGLFFKGYIFGWLSLYVIIKIIEIFKQ
jgi:hypothetical protein